MIRVQEEDFDPGSLIERLSHAPTGETGAVATFLGLVRADKSAGGEAIQAMTLEHYPGMTERQLESIAEEAKARWPLLDVQIVHRFGRLEPGERIVFVGVASAHRDAAFDACRFLMDWLKTKAPFWKLEETASGTEQWVDARDSDDAAAARWNAPPA